MPIKWIDCESSECEFEPNDGYFHEALDRSYVMGDMFHDHIQNHWVVVHEEELKQEAEKIADALGKFYQLVATKMCEFEDI